VEQGAGAATRRWKLLIAYDGAAFRGFAVQPEVPTVAGALCQALERTARLSAPPPMTCAGRTDAGVHARGQVVHVDLPAIPYDGPRLARALNRQLAPAVVVHRAEEVGPDFDARRSATGRTYRYLVWNARDPDPLLAPVAWHVRDPLDLRAMRTATDVLLGSHDFRSFCRRKPGTDPSEPIVRRVTMARWSVDEGAEAADAVAGGEGRLLRFEIAAGSFCHQMVRSLVASLVEVGRGRQNAAGLMERLRAAKRESGPDPAPARGLCLVSVAYAPGGGGSSGGSGDSGGTAGTGGPEEGPAA
jgi:tRNA pseudouridine38-40 synthase